MDTIGAPRDEHGSGASNEDIHGGYMGDGGPAVEDSGSGRGSDKGSAI